MNLQFNQFEGAFRSLDFEPMFRIGAEHLYFRRLGRGDDRVCDWIYLLPAMTKKSCLVLGYVRISLCKYYSCFHTNLESGLSHHEHPFNNDDDLFRLRSLLVDQVRLNERSDRYVTLKNDLLSKSKEIRSLSLEYIQMLPQNDPFLWFQNQANSEIKNAALQYAASPICVSHFFRPHYEVAIYVMLAHCIEIEGKIPDFEGIDIVHRDPELQCKVALIVDHLLGFLPLPIVHEEGGVPKLGKDFGQMILTILRNGVQIE